MNRPLIATLAYLVVGVASAAGAQAADPHGMSTHGDMPPMMDSAWFSHALLDRMEARYGSAAPDMRWQGQAWIGGDYDKLKVKTQGILKPGGRVEDGRHELLYDRAIFRYMDLQLGVRADLDSRVGRTWGAVGIQGVAPLFIDYELTAYLSDRGHAAARVALATDVLLTQSLVLQPEIEANLYSKADPRRGIGTGFADLDVGLRLRYEITRKFAPYVGVSYTQKFGETARLGSLHAEHDTAWRFLIGIRGWF